MSKIVAAIVTTVVLSCVAVQVYAQATYGQKCVRNGNTTTCTPCKMPYC